MKKKLVKIAVVLLVFLMVFMAGCNGENNDGPNNSGNGPNKPAVFVPVTDIIDIPMTGYAGEGLTLAGRVVPDTATNKTIVWTVKTAGATGASITGNKLNISNAGAAVITGTVTKGISETEAFTKDFTITFDDIDALTSAFEVRTRDGLAQNLILGNSLAWIKDAKEGSELVFLMSSIVYPTGAENPPGNPLRPQAGDTIAVIGNSTENSISITIPEGTSPGAGRSVRLAIPIDEALALIGTDTSLKVDVIYGSVNACQLMEPRMYQVPLSPNAQRMMNFFEDIYGEKMFSGIMDISWEDSQYTTINAISNDSGDQSHNVFRITGKYPALKGFDFIQHRDRQGNANPTPNIRQQTEEALRWWNGYDRHNRQWVKISDIPGIIAYCWHWAYTDGGYYGNDEDRPQTVLRIPMLDGKLDKSHPYFTYIKGEIDRVIAEINWIREHEDGGDVPIIWRPLHEAGGNEGRGGWFWWGVPGTDGSTASMGFKALWEYMYDYMTVVHGLDNLIWLCNAQGDAMNTWVPDRKTFHLTGYDHYIADHEPQKYLYDLTKNMAPDIMVTLSEAGRIPDPDKCYEQDAMWLFFMIWDRMFYRNNVRTGTTPEQIQQSEAYRFFNHPRVINLDTLPNLKTYRLD